MTLILLKYTKFLNAPIDIKDDLYLAADAGSDSLLFLSRGFGKTSANPTMIIPTVVTRTAAHL